MSQYKKIKSLRKKSVLVILFFIVMLALGTGLILAPTVSKLLKSGEKLEKLEKPLKTLEKLQEPIKTLEKLQKPIIALTKEEGLIQRIEDEMQRTKRAIAEIKKIGGFVLGFILLSNVIQLVLQILSSMSIKNS